MTSPDRIQHWLPRLFAIIYFVCSLYLMIPFAIGCVGSGYTGLDSSPYGHISRPTVYRALLPTMAKAVHAAIPEAIEKPLTERMIAWRDSGEGRETVKSLFIRPPPLGDHKIFETAVVALVSYLTLLAFIWMFYELARALFPESLAYALFAPLIALQLIPALTVENGYIYDFAEMFFMCALLYLLLKERWGLYMLCLAVGTYNKETTFFAIAFYMAWFFSRLPRGRYLKLLGVQIAIYTAIKAGLTWYYADLPGVIAQHHMAEQWHYLLDHPIGLSAGLATCAFFIFYKWREKPLFLRYSLFIFLLNTIAYLVICVAGEYRDFYSSLPMFILMATHTIISISGIADHPVFAIYPKEKAA